MTVSSAITRKEFDGNGVSTSFSYPYYFLQASDLVVKLIDASGGVTDWTLNTQYTVTGAGDPAGGSIEVKTTPTDYTPASGETLIVYNDPAVTQGVDLVNNDPSDAEVLEKAYDRLTMIAKRTRDLISRAVRMDDGDATDFSPTLPSPIVAQRYIRTNTSGDGLEFVDLENTDADAIRSDLKSGLAEVSEWAYGQSATYSDANTFTTDTTKTDDAGEYIFQDNRRVRIYRGTTGDYLYGTLTALGTRGSNGTVDVSIDDGTSLTNEALTVLVSLNSVGAGSGLQEYYPIHPDEIGVVVPTDYTFPHLNIRRYGASASASAATNDAAFASAVSVAQSGSEIIIPDEIFTFGQFTINQSGVTVRIKGKLQQDNSTQNRPQINVTAPDVLITGGVIDANGTRGDVIFGDTGSSRLRVEHVEVKNMQCDMSTPSGDFSAVVFNENRCIVKDCVFRDLENTGAPNDSHPRAVTMLGDDCEASNLTFYNCNDGVLSSGRDNVMHSNHHHGGTDNAYYISGNNALLRNITITENADEPIVLAGDGHIVQDVTVSGWANAIAFYDATNVMFLRLTMRKTTTQPANCVKIRSSNTTSSGITFQDCYFFASPAYGWLDFSVGTLKDLVVQGCYFECSFESGSFSNGESINITNATEYVFTGNTIIYRDPSALMAAADYYIRLEGATSYSIFKNNDLVNRSASGRFRVSLSDRQYVEVNNLFIQPNTGFLRDRYYSGLPGSEFVTDGPDSGISGTQDGDVIYRIDNVNGGRLGYIQISGVLKDWGDIAI